MTTLSEIIYELDKYKFETSQHNIDSNINDDKLKNDSNKQIELVTIDGVDVTNKNSTNIQMYESLVNEENNINDVKKRDGLSNKFILYKNPKQHSNNNKNQLEYNLNHTGLYFCDEKQNIYKISQDFRFNNTIKEAISLLVKKVEELENRISHM